MTNHHQARPLQYPGVLLCYLCSCLTTSIIVCLYRVSTTLSKVMEHFPASKPHDDRELEGYIPNQYVMSTQRTHVGRKEVSDLTSWCNRCLYVTRDLIVLNPLHPALDTSDVTRHSRDIPRMVLALSSTDEHAMSLFGGHNGLIVVPLVG